MDKIIISGQCSKVGKTKFVEKTINNLCGKIFAFKAAVSKDKEDLTISVEKDAKNNEGNNVIDFVNPTIIIFLKNDNLENKYSADKASRKADIIIDYSNDKRDIIFNKESMICYKAHLLADILGISVGRIGKLLNKADIKIKGCQLGLF